MIGTEAPVQEKVIDQLAAIGWRPVGRVEMGELRQGRMGEPLVEPLLVDALRALNDGLSQTDALQVVDQLRRVPDSEAFLKIVRDGLDVAFNPDEPTRHITVVDWLHPERNDYVVTDEFELKTGAMREPRLDVVCLVNGIPLGLVETKSGRKGWKEAVKDYRTYWTDAPELEKYVAVCVAADMFRFRCAPGGATKLAQYAEWKDSWPHQMPEEHRELEIGCLGLLDPHNLADIAANFVVFETRDGATVKKLARYQQFRGANKVVKRVVDGELDRGIVWHTQGSGKSLTMVFAARKLKNVGLGNPTILIVIDRIDLDDQINETFTATSFEGVVRATSRERLRQLLAADTRGVIITTVQKFDESMPELSDRENVIALVDEAHRTQEGLHAIRMRAALPKAKLFAFTGTPIEQDARSTWRAFAPQVDGEYERYLDSYTPKQAIEDKATVEVRYEPRLVELAHFTGDDLDASLEPLIDDLDEAAQEKVKADAARLAVVAKAQARIEPIVADVIDYMRNRVDPQGFKAQLVAVDREACWRYADELLRQGMKPEEIAVIYTPNIKHDDEDYRRWYAAEQWKRVHGGAAEADVELEDDSDLDLGEAKARKKLIEEFKKPETPLKLLIVTDMLLTGFDAPIEQVMFLDKPLRGAKLLQAIMRTNRPFPEKKKDRGVIVDYWGVFERLQDAFAEFSPDEIELAVLNLAELRETFPVRLKEALALVAAMPADAPEYEQMMWLLKHFSDDKEAGELFEERFESAQSAYETLAPDPSLAPYLDDYRRLVALRALWRHATREDQEDAAGEVDLDEYRPQTHTLVQDAVSVERLRTDLPVYRIDGSYLRRLDEMPGSPDEKAAEAAVAVEYEIRVRGEHDPVARSLAERLERIRQRKQEEDAEMLSLLTELCQEYVAEQEAHQARGLSERAQAFFSLARSADGLSEDEAAELAQATDEIVERHAAFPAWAERDDVVRAIRRELLTLLLRDDKTAKLVDAGFIDEALHVAVAREAALD